MIFTKYKKSVGDTWLLTSATLLGSGALFASTTVLAKSLSTSDFGQLATLLSLASVFAGLSSFGVATYWLKTFGRYGYSACQLIPLTFRFIVLTTLCSSALFLAVTTNFLTIKTDYRILFCLILVIVSQGLLDLSLARSQLIGKIKITALLTMLPGLLRLFLIIFFLIFLGASSTLHYVIAVALGAFMVSLICLTTQSGLFSSSIILAYRSDTTTTQIVSEGLTFTDISVARGSLPFGLINGLHLLYMNLGIIGVSLYFETSATAFYSIAFMVTSIFYLVPSILFQKVLSVRMFQYQGRETENLLREYRRMSLYLFAYGVLAYLLVTNFLAPLVPYFLGSAYSDSVPIINILALSIPIYFGAAPFESIALLQDCIYKKVSLTFFLILINLGSIFFLVPLFGLEGIAYSFVLSQFVSAIVHLRFLAPNGFVDLPLKATNQK